ncbi:PP2C family protein-serine/threonine phosphatase [Streptomyces sp. V4-01]|uniref:PP2C family protein-serine/threonine phosphatase n=1 Tax=Actinacidiphila polyblastidii TaxID=3110430 RepID=A0ABU7P9E3_9ACTN|nr:PP2C family protein-serine/threonine phosphatase [Streptomyces sp. V4-01]
MEPTGATGQSRVSWLPRSPAARLAVPMALVALLLGIDEAGGPQLRIGGLMVAVPALAAAFLWPRAVMVLVLFTLACIVLAAQNNDQIGTESFYVVLATVVLIGAGAVAAARIRQRRERQLAQVRWVAAVIQQVVLRPLPARLGPLSLASMYLAAQEEAAIGGDLYGVAALDDGAARLIVGDVQGKGLGAVEVAGLLLGAFRRASRRRVPLGELPRCLDADLRSDLSDLAGAASPAPGREATAGSAVAAPDRGPTALEGFVTAVMVEVPAGGSPLRLVNCGHPPPLLLRRGSVLALGPATPGLPLGLGDLGPDPEATSSHDLEVGDIVLLYTDGVIETRDASGAFYPLALRLPELAADSLEDLLFAVRADLERHAATRLGDDVAMVAFQRMV